MKYMLLMYANPDETKAMSAADRDSIARKHQALVAELTASGELLGGAGLAYPEETRTLRLQNGAAVTSEGPLASAREHLTSYYVVDCKDLDRALSLAGRLLDFHVTAVEVRPVHDSVGMQA